MKYWHLRIFDCDGNEVAQLTCQRETEMRAAVNKYASEYCHITLQVIEVRVLQQEEVIKLLPFLTEDLGVPLLQGNGIVH